MRLAVAEPSADRRADTGRDVRVERVHVEADVDEAVVVARDVLERLAEDALDPQTIDMAHRPDAQAVLADELALARIERAGADDRDARAVGGRHRPGLPLELGTGEAERP